MPKTKATIYNVAMRADVSLATVSRTLNNPEKVKKETREKVLKVIDELGYKPNAFARGLASRKSTSVAVMVPDMTRSSVAEMVNGIAVEARKYDYSLILYVLKDEYKEESEMMKEVIASQADGILYMNDEISEEQYQMLDRVKEDYSVPIVFANTLYPYENKLTTVCIDYHKAGYDVTKELIDEGRKNIYMLTTARKYMVNDLKESGYLKAMEEAGLEPHIFRTSGNISVNSVHFDELYKEAGKKIDGVVAVRDSIAVSFINAMIAKGKKVPKDISVFGFQNTKYASLARPRLSCIDVPITEIGVRAMALLKQEIDEGTKNTQYIELPYSIIHRDSTNK